MLLPSLPPIPIPSGPVGYAVVAGLVAMVSGYGQIFTKAHCRPWEVFVPVYNGVVLARIVGRPAWWGVALWAGPASALAVPCVRFACDGFGRSWWALAAPGLLVTAWFHWRISKDLAKSFGCGAEYGRRLALLPVVYVPWLGWGYAEYKGPAATAESHKARRVRRKDEEEKARAAYAAKQAQRQAQAPAPAAAPASPAASVSAPADSRPVDPFVV